MAGAHSLNMETLTKLPTTNNSISLGFPTFASLPFVRDMNDQDNAADGDVLMNCQNSLKPSPSPHQEFDSPGLKTGRPDSVTCSQLPPKKLYTDDIPVLDPFPGYYGFDFYHPLCEDAYEATETKPSTAYFYFKDDQGWTNLYAKKAPTWWTLSYWCQRQPPEGCFIRLVPVYGTSDKQQEVIQRCLEDFMASPTPGTARYSMILVGNSLAEYFYDLNTERLCVCLPYERPKEGCEYSQFNGKFTCFNSCLYNGGQGNKKPLFLIVTLERPLKGGNPMHGPCEVLGRQCLKFRSCACPKRDKDNNERRIAQDMVESGLNGTGQVPNSKRRREAGGERAQRGSRNNTSNGITPRGKGFNDNCNERVSPTYSTKLPVYRDHLSGLRVDSDFTMVDDLRSSGSLGFDDRQNMIQLNGEIFHVILMPACLPGGASTLRQMRSALLKTFYAAKDLQSAASGFLSRDAHDQDQKLISNESCFVIENKQSSIYEDNFIQFIQNVEGKAASLIREMQTSPGYQTLNPFMSASCSTDSQPNSTASLNSTLGSLMGGVGGGGGGDGSQQGALDMLASHVNGAGLSLDQHNKLDESSLNFLQAGIAPLRNNFSSPFPAHKMPADGGLSQNQHHNYLAVGEQAFTYPMGLSQQQQHQQQQQQQNHQPNHQQQQARRLTYPQLRLPPLSQSQLFDGLANSVGPEVVDVSQHVRSLFSPANGGGELAPPLGSASSSASSYSHSLLQQQAHSTFQVSSSASTAIPVGPPNFRPQTQKSVGTYQSDVFLSPEANRASPGHIPLQQGQRLLETAQALVCSTKASSPTASTGIYMNQSKMFEDISSRTRTSTDASMSSLSCANSSPISTASSSYEKVIKVE